MMSLKITRDEVKGLFVLKPKGLPAITTKSILDISPVIAHYFGTDKEHHNIFKRKRLCLLCDAEEAALLAGPVGDMVATQKEQEEKKDA